MAPRNKNEKLLRPIHPNAGIEAAYRAKLTALVQEMHASVLYWVKASYRANEPEMAQDETPAEALRRVIRELSKRWMKRFDVAAVKLADWFGQAASKRSSDGLKKILKDGGFSVEFKLTPAMRDVLGATVNQNVALIKSIPQQYLTQVEGIVMRSVQTGRDLGQLTSDLQTQLGVTKRRAAFIALDQNNKATAALTRARQIEAGITEAVWVHSGGGRHPRPSHLKAGREKQRFDVTKGWYDPDEKKNIWPGELINCRCVSRSVIKGFS